MAGAIIEGLESRQLFNGAAAVVGRLVHSPRLYNGTFVTVVSGKQKLTETARFFLDYLKNTNPTVPNDQVHPDVSTSSASSPFRLIIEEPTVLFTPFPTVYTFSVNAKQPLKLFSIKQKDSLGDTMTFTGTYTLKTGAISGALKIKGPNRAESQTYRVKPTP